MLDENASIEELSAQLMEQIERNSRVPPRDRTAEMMAFVADHLAAEPQPARRLEVTPDEYQELAGLSSTTAKTLIARSPAHALAAHPWFGARDGKRITKEMDHGTRVHSLSLGVGKRFAVIDAPNYKTKAAQVERDQARAAGFIPTLRRELGAAEACAEQVRAQLAGQGIELTGESEVALEWWESTSVGHVRCRGMLDHVWLDRGLVLDLKIVGDASAAAIERSSEAFGYAIQEAAYRRGITQLVPSLLGRVDFLFAFCEATPPFALNIVRGDGMFRELGERRWTRALATWAHCLSTNTWPAFGAGINSLGVPTWALRNEGFEA